MANRYAALLAMLYLSPSGATELADSDKLLALMNAERSRAGIPALVPEHRLQLLADGHAVFLAIHWRALHEAGAVPYAQHLEYRPGCAHGCAVGPAARGAELGLALVRENAIAEALNIETAHGLFMQSASHRRHVLDRRLRAVGIGAVRHPASGKWSVVVDFGG